MQRHEQPSYPENLRGRLRRRVYDLLTTPRTGRILLNELAQKQRPPSYQDLRHMLRDFESKDWIRCLNPSEQTGRIYLRTDQRLEKGDWALLSHLIRGANRAPVLGVLCSAHWTKQSGLTASDVRRQLRDSTKMGLSHVLRAMAFLEAHQLIECVGYTRKRSLRLFKPTEEGRDLHLLVSQMQ